MKAKSVTVGSERTFVLVLDQGEEAFGAITNFANKEQVSGAAVTAIGAVAHAEVGWFDLAAKSYERIAVNEQCEVLSLIGDVAESDDGKASLHLHAVLGLRDGSVRGRPLPVGFSAADAGSHDQRNSQAYAAEKARRSRDRYPQSLSGRMNQPIDSLHFRQRSRV